MHFFDHIIGESENKHLHDVDYKIISFLPYFKNNICSHLSFTFGYYDVKNKIQANKANECVLISFLIKHYVCVKELLSGK